MTRHTHFLIHRHPLYSAREATPPSSARGGGGEPASAPDRLGDRPRQADNPPGADATPKVSQAILEELQALRQRQAEKGHDPASDSRRTRHHFRDALTTFLRRADTAKRAANRRKNLLIAAGVLIAQIEAEDFCCAHSKEGDETDADEPESN